MMKQSAVAACAFLLFVPAQRAHAAAPIDSTRALAKGRELAPYVGRGEGGPLWSQFDDHMRAAMGDSIRFGAMMTGIHAEIGVLVEVLSEEMVVEQGIWVYRAHCQFAKSPQPALLTIAFDPDGRVAGLAVRPDAPKEYPSTKLDYVTQTALELPVRGEWYVFWGGRTLDQNRHAVAKSQRFACDLVMRKGEQTHAGDGKKLTDYYCYGAQIYSPADGTVVSACDSFPDQTPGQMDAAHPAGNHVIIDHGHGEFSLLAHLQPKSLRVKAGDVVTVGQAIGLCGNSGNTSEPHLHFHLMDGPDMTTAEGLPAPFVHVCIDGKPVESAEPVRGQTIQNCFPYDPTNAKKR